MIVQGKISLLYFFTHSIILPILHFWHQICGFLYTPTNSPTPAGCPIIPFNSDPRWSLRRPRRFRARSHKTVLHFRHQSPVVGPQVTHNLSDLLQIGSSHKLLRFNNLLECLRESRKSLLIADLLQRIF